MNAATDAPAATPGTRASGFGLLRREGESWARFATRVGNAFGVVLLLVLAVYVLGSLLWYRGWGAIVINAAAGACGTIALLSAGARLNTVRATAIVALGAVILTAIGALAGGSAALGISALVVAGLLSVAAGKVLVSVLAETEVGFRTILGAISVYVILGLLFSFLYAAIDRLQAGLFFGSPLQKGDFSFFSITTLTTTGYGNLIPAGQPGRMLSGLEMLIGQIFLVTLIAGLVSLWRPGLARRDRKR